jgi:catechol 2,3-dioxygenase-like lactoylglutathione lyase family enzyme
MQPRPAGKSLLARRRRGWKNHRQPTATPTAAKERARRRKMLKTDGVLHFTIPVKDLDRSEKFYTEIMGMEKVRRTGHMVFLTAAGKDNFVLTYSEKPIDPNPDGKHEIHSAFRMSADEYDRAKAFLASRGIRIFKEEDRQSGTFQGRSAYFHDPDHNVIEIMNLVRGPVSEKEQ